MFAFASSSVWAYDVDDTTTAVTAIKNSTSNQEISFDPTGNYNNFNVTVPSTAQNLTLQGNGATITGNGNHVFIIDNTVGLTIKNFIININSSLNGIRGENVTRFTITNCTIINGGAGINIFGISYNNTINNNTIANMGINGGNGNGISLVDHMTNSDPNVRHSLSYINNNNILNVSQGMFIGGNFYGSIINNTITGASEYGIHFVGRQTPTNGVVVATITGNNINSNGIGLSLETPIFAKLDLEYNTIYGANMCVEVGPLATFTQLFVLHNAFWGGEGDLETLYELAGNNWDQNTLNGILYP